MPRCPRPLCLSLVCLLSLAEGCTSTIEVPPPPRYRAYFNGFYAWGLALDDTHVYWSVSDPKQGVISSAQKDGGDPRTLAAQLHSPRGILLHDGWLYVAVAGDGTIQRVPLDGGALEVVQTGQESVQELAADDQNLYWINPSVGELGGAGEVMAAAFDGGVPHALGIGYVQPEALAVDDGGVYWAVRGAVAYDGYGMPYYPNGYVYQSPKDGSGPQLLARLQLDLHTVAAESGRVYWASNGDGRTAGALVMRDSQSGETATIKGPFDAWAVAPTAAGAFISGLADPDFCPEMGYLAFFPYDGGVPTDYSASYRYGDPVKLLVDDQGVYLTDPCDGVFRVQR